MGKRILSISYDDSLLRTRHWILERAGYEVTSALGFLEAQEACLKTRFDLVVIGHSIPLKDKIALARLAQTGCGAAILSLRIVGQEPIPEATFSTERSDPEALLETVQQAL